MRDDSEQPIEDKSVERSTNDDSMPPNGGWFSLVSGQSQGPVQLVDRCKNLLTKLQNDFAELDDEKYWEERFSVYRAGSQIELSVEKESREGLVEADDTRNTSHGSEELRDHDSKHTSTLAELLERDSNDTLAPSMSGDNKSETTKQSRVSQISKDFSMRSNTSKNLTNETRLQLHREKLEGASADTTPCLPGSTNRDEEAEQPIDQSSGVVQETVRHDSKYTKKSTQRNRKIVKVLLKSLKAMRPIKQQSNTDAVVVMREPEKQNHDLTLESGVHEPSVRVIGLDARDDVKLSTVSPSAMTLVDAARSHDSPIEDMSERQAPWSNDVSPDQATDLGLSRQESSLPKDYAGGDAHEEEEVQEQEQEQEQLIQQPEQLQQKEPEQQQLQEDTTATQQAAIFEAGTDEESESADTLEENSKQMLQQFASLRGVFAMWRCNDAGAASDIMTAHDLHGLAKANVGTADPAKQAAAVDDAEQRYHVGQKTLECGRRRKEPELERQASSKDSEERDGAVSNEVPSPIGETVPLRSQEPHVPRGSPSDAKEDDSSREAHQDSDVDVVRRIHGAAALDGVDEALATAPSKDQLAEQQSQRSPQLQLAEKELSTTETRDAQDVRERVSKGMKDILIDISRLKKPVKRHGKISERQRRDSLAADKTTMDTHDAQEKASKIKMNVMSKISRFKKSGKKHTKSQNNNNNAAVDSLAAAKTVASQESETQSIHEEVSRSKKNLLTDTSGFKKPAKMRGLALGIKKSNANNVIAERAAMSEERETQRVREKDSERKIYIPGDIPSFEKLSKKHDKTPADTESHLYRSAAENIGKSLVTNEGKESVPVSVKSVFAKKGKHHELSKTKTVEGLDLAIRMIAKPFSDDVVEISSVREGLAKSPSFRVDENPTGREEESEKRPTASKTSGRKEEKADQEEAKELAEVNRKPKKDKTAKKKKKEEKSIRKREKKQKEKEKRVKLRQQFSHAGGIDESKHAIKKLDEGMTRTTDSMDKIQCSEVSLQLQVSGTQSEAKKDRRALSWLDQVQDGTVSDKLPSSIATDESEGAIKELDASTTRPTYSLDTIQRSEVSLQVEASGTQSGAKKYERALSWSDEVQDGTVSDKLPPSQSVIWWSTSKDAVEILVDEGDDNSTESDFQSSVGTTVVSEVTFASLPPLDFSLSTMLEVRDVLLEEASIMKQDFIDEVREKASSLVLGLFRDYLGPTSSPKTQAKQRTKRIKRSGG
jgi:hypothetical protein